MHPRQHPFHRRFERRGLLPREVSASIEIDAPAADVWAVLIDFEGYARWNPFTPRVETVLGVGEPARLHVDMPGFGRLVRTEWINLVEPERTLCWGMHLGAPALLCANRWQQLSPLPSGGTRYSTVDRLSGLLTPVVMRCFGRAMRRGFLAVAEGLKTFCEDR